MRDLWQYLKDESASGRPILLYGMGNGADKIIAVCHHHGIPVADVFASDGFVRGHAFHGKTVLSFSEARAKYGDGMIVLLAFASSRPEVLELIDRVAATCELYIPDVPVSGREVFDADFYEAHKAEIHAARELFCDEESRRVYDGIIEYKLTGRMDVLRATESTPEEAMQSILHTATFRVAADLGAYNGDSIRALRVFAPELTDVIAMEPDRRNLRKLTEYATTLAESGDPLRIHIAPHGAWNKTETLTFRASGNRNATLGDTATVAEVMTMLPSTEGNPYFGKTDEVSVRALDEIAAELIGDTRIHYIKYDVEGVEREALLGSQGIIRRDAPCLLVSAYHRSADLFRLPLLVHELNPGYRLYLRRMSGVPAWDINLYAVTE